jgi:hypothetical protein
MNSRDLKAAKFLDLFRDLKSLEDLQKCICSLQDNSDEGRAFEVFAEAYLATQRKDLDPEQLWPQGTEPWPFEDLMKREASFFRNKPDINELVRACLKEKCRLTQIFMAGSF